MKWKNRLKNKAFWAACVGLVVLILQYIQSYLTFDLNISVIEKILTAIVLCAVTLGILIDPTTPGVKDSDTNKVGGENNGDDLNRGTESP